MRDAEYDHLRVVYGLLEDTVLKKQEAEQYHEEAKASGEGEEHWKKVSHKLLKDLEEIEGIMIAAQEHVANAMALSETRLKLLEERNNASDLMGRIDSKLEEVLADNEAERLKFYEEINRKNKELDAQAIYINSAVTRFENKLSAGTSTTTTVTKSSNVPMIDTMSQEISSIHDLFFSLNDRLEGAEKTVAVCNKMRKKREGKDLLKYPQINNEELKQLYRDAGYKVTNDILAHYKDTGITKQGLIARLRKIGVYRGRKDK